MWKTERHQTQRNHPAPHKASAKKRAQEHPRGKQSPNADMSNYTKSVKYFDKRSPEETRKGFNLSNLLL